MSFVCRLAQRCNVTQITHGMTGSPVQMLRREQLACAVEGALQQMEEDHARQRRSGSLVSMHLPRKGQCPELRWLLPFKDCLGLANHFHDGRAPTPGSIYPPTEPTLLALWRPEGLARS